SGIAYVKTFSGVCGPDGTIAVPLGANFPCIVTNTLVEVAQANPTALLTINTVVDAGQLSSGASACSFIMRVKTYDSAHHIDGSTVTGLFKGAPTETCVHGATPVTTTNNVGLAPGTTAATQSYRLVVDPLNTPDIISIATFSGDCDSSGIITIVPG